MKKILIAIITVFAALTWVSENSFAQPNPDCFKKHRHHHYKTTSSTFSATDLTEVESDDAQKDGAILDAVILTSSKITFTSSEIAVQTLIQNSYQPLPLHAFSGRFFNLPPPNTLT